MTDRDALLAAVMSSPHDDTPRLIFADFLEESGEQEQAKFVRAGVEVSKLTKCGHKHPLGRMFADGTCIVCTLKDRERQAFIEWSGRDERRAIPQVAKGGTFGYGAWSYDNSPASRNQELRWLLGGDIEAVLRRGFIDSIRGSWDDWMRHHGILYWHPEQTVECPDCLDENTGRIRRPFQPTAHPLTKVELTSTPTNISNEDQVWIAEYRFDRVKCRMCGGTNRVTREEPTYGGTVMTMPCSECHGTPPNQWRCEAWPTIVFAMPEERATT